MVLHLLGKKSWNVYNSANIQKVRQDEAEALAREEAEELRMQQEDAERRIALLRGRTPPPLSKPAADPTSKESEAQGDRQQSDHPRPHRKRRRLRGEDDTDCAIRYAREDADANKRSSLALLSARESDAPLRDAAGNIQLVPAPDDAAIRQHEKNAEAEAEEARKRRRDEDQYTMRFSNAAGYDKNMGKPWYATGASSTPSTARPGTASDMVLAESQGKDVWGNEDPRRKERERGRLTSGDPFAAMQRAQKQLKQSARDRETWNKKQAAELAAIDDTARRRRKHQREIHSPDGDEASLNGFSLDSSKDRHRHDQRDRPEKHRHRDRRRHSRSRSEKRT